MIKSLTGTELSSSKTRAGLSSISDLLPRLIRSYELQAELVQRRSQMARPNRPMLNPPRTSQVQNTFGWYQ